MKYAAHILTLITVMSAACVQESHPGSLVIRFDEPAAQWEETFPLGNGRIGMMPDGGIDDERIVLNEISLWSGGEQDADRDSASRYLPEIRQLLLEGKNSQAQQLMNEHFVSKGEGSGLGNGANVPFGCYQILANLDISYQYDDQVGVVDYSRKLDINRAIAATEFMLDGVTYSREYFTSFKEDVGIVRLSSSQANKINATFSLNRPERAEVFHEGGDLVLEGQLPNGKNDHGMKFQTRLRVLHSGGDMKVSDSAISVKKSSEVYLFIGAGTDYWGNDIATQIQTALSGAVGLDYQDHRELHERKYTQLFERVDFQLMGESQSDSLTIDERLGRFAKDPHQDIGLVPLFFQYGRYLAISSVREGLLPANLQGLWANQIQTPWNGDYHLDINMQMNHWPLEVTNLSRLSLPLVGFMEKLSAQGEKTAREYYDADGWVAHVISNVWGFSSPGEQASWGSSTAGSGWLCNNLWQHYDFTNDTTYLERIYPILRGAAEFYNSILITEPDHGWLVTAPSISPENGFYLPNDQWANVCVGSTFDNQVVRELFTHVVTASQVLGKDVGLRKELQAKLLRLAPIGQVGSDGRLMEWLKEYKEADKHHRHLSHLYGLFPGDLITPTKTPSLAAAAENSLNVRGDEGPSWSKAHKMLLWARLGEGDRAYNILKSLLHLTRDTNINYGDGGAVYPNLLSAGPPFQIDGNFGGTAAIAEMLIQSHDGYIELLPALPEAWRQGGSIRGLKARGGFTVDFQWENGQVTSCIVKSEMRRTVSIKYNEKVRKIMSIAS